MPSRPELTGTFGAVSSTHWLASSAGLAILERGGNAFDAAVAAGFALQVVEPHSCGPASDVSIALYSAVTGQVTIICGQGPMPRIATAERFRALGLGQIPGSGLLPACVPGGFGGWMRLLAEYGTMRVSDVLQHAIGYATAGYPILPATAMAIRLLAPLFAEEWPESGRVYLRDGTPPEPGSRVRNQVLAATYRRILAEAEAAGPGREAQIEAANDAFYRGFVAEAIDAYVRDTAVLDATGRRNRGLLTADDLAAWQPTAEPPASLDYGRYTVCKPGPWSQGPVFLQQLAILEPMDLSSLGLDSAAYIHAVAEAAKLALADREAWYGDPSGTPVPMDALLSREYATRRRALIGPQAADSPQPGVLDGQRSWMPVADPDSFDQPDNEVLAQLRNGIPTVVRQTARSGDTCTVMAADRDGNLVAAVPSGGWLKSSPVIPGLGFPLGTRGQTMWLAPGHPNSLVPGRRPRTTLSPTVALREGKPFLAFGTPGGDQQDQWTLQFFLAVTEFGLDLQSATETVAFHTDHFPASFAPRTARPGVLVVEEQCGAAVIGELRDRGHRVDMVPAYSQGKVCAAGFDPERGLIRAAAGPRGRQAYAMGR